MISHLKGATLGIAVLATLSLAAAPSCSPALAGGNCAPSKPDTSSVASPSRR